MTILSQISLEVKEVVCKSVELHLSVCTCACQCDPGLLTEAVCEATAVCSNPCAQLCLSEHYWKWFREGRADHLCMCVPMTGEGPPGESLETSKLSERAPLRAGMQVCVSVQGRSMAD